MCELRGISEREVAKLCRPPTQQAAISRFENAADALTHKRAEQLAAAYFGELWATKDKDKRELAINGVWKLWFANVEAHGSPSMKSAAAELKANWTEYPWEEPATGLFAGQAPREQEKAERAVTV